MDDDLEDLKCQAEAIRRSAREDAIGEVVTFLREPNEHGLLDLEGAALEVERAFGLRREQASR